MCARNAPSRRVLEPAALVRLTGHVLADHQPKAQEDAQEYLRMLLDKVQSQMPPENGLKSIFGGILHSQRFCTGCGEHPPKPEAFHNLSLEIGARATSVSECLDHYSADEDIVLEPVFTPIADMVLTMAEVAGTVSMHRRRTEDRRLYTVVL